MSSRSVSEPFAATRDGFVIAEGAGRAHPRGVGGRRGARGHDPRRGPRRRVHRRRPPHHRPVPGRARRAVVHGDRAGVGRPHRRRHRRTSTPTARPRRSTTPPRPRRWPSCSARPGPAVTSIKGVTGHSLGAAGAIEAVAVVESMRRRLIPPTAVHHRGRPRAPRRSTSSWARPAPWEPGPTLSNSFGFGGHNGTLVLAPRRPRRLWSTRSLATDSTQIVAQNRVWPPDSSSRSLTLAGRPPP